MFGEEGERLAQQRALAQKRYAEELRQQIAERQGQGSGLARPQPDFGSPPARDLYPDPPAPFSPPQRPPSLLQQAQRNSIAQPKDARGRSQMSGSPRLEALPDLPPSGPSPDVIRFADRLNWLESSIDQHQSILRAASESANRIERVSIPSLSDGIEQMKSSIDNISRVDLPGRLRPLEDENQRLEEKISSASAEFAQNAQDLREGLGNITSAFSQTQSRFSEFSDSVKSTVLEFKNEIVQARDAHDSVAQRISQAEAKASQTEESLRGVDTALQTFERTANDGLSSAQQQINSAVSAAALQIAQELKMETEERDRASVDLHAKTEEVNQKAAQGVAHIQTSINDLAVSFNRSLQTLESSVRDALDNTRNQSDQQYRDLSARLDELLAQTENNFKTVQNESVSTLESLNEHAARARDELETALTQECETRKQNEIQIVQRYDNFKGLIVNEMQLQTTQMEQMSEQAKQNVIKKCNEQITPLKVEISKVRERTRGAEVLPQKVAQIEKVISQLNSQLVDNMGALGQKSSQIVAAVDKMRGEADQTLDHLSERLRIVEAGETKADFATRNDVSESFRRLNTEFDGRMQEIEQQIGVMFSSLSDMTMTMPPPVTSHEPGAALIDQLANAQAE